MAFTAPCRRRRRGISPYSPFQARSRMTRSMRSSSSTSDSSLKMPKLGRTAPGQVHLLPGHEPSAQLGRVGEAEEAMQVGVGAEAAVADGDGGFAVEDAGRELVGDAVDRQRERADPLRRVGVPEHRHAVELPEPVHGALHERPLVLAHRLHARLLEEAEGRGERHGAGDVRGAALVPVGRLLVEGLVLGDVDDGAAGRDVRRGLVEEVDRHRRGTTSRRGRRPCARPRRRSRRGRGRRSGGGPPARGPGSAPRPPGPSRRGRGPSGRSGGCRAGIP